ncbi:hypothetical protein GQ457_13G000620 [Hibiscus cannabinus]
MLAMMNGDERFVEPTPRSSRNSEREHEFSPILFRTSPSDLQFQQIFLKDTDEKACALFPLQKHNSIPRRETMFGRICKEKLRGHPLFNGAAS